MTDLTKATNSLTASILSVVDNPEFHPVLSNLDIPGCLERAVGSVRRMRKWGLFFRVSQVVVVIMAGLNLGFLLGTFPAWLNLLQALAIGLMADCFRRDAIMIRDNDEHLEAEEKLLQAYMRAKDLLPAN